MIYTHRSTNVEVPDSRHTLAHIWLVIIHHILTRGTPSENKCIFRSPAVRIERRWGGIVSCYDTHSKRLKLMALRPSLEWHPSPQRAISEQQQQIPQLTATSTPILTTTLKSSKQLSLMTRHDGRQGYPPMLICDNKMVACLCMYVLLLCICLIYINIYVYIEGDRYRYLYIYR